VLSTPAAAQTLDDGIMLEKGGLLTGDLYTHDTWDEYWEGVLKRDNGNIGTLTTRTNIWVATYGLTRRLNLIAIVPHVRTREVSAQQVRFETEPRQEIMSGDFYGRLSNLECRLPHGVGTFLSDENAQPRRLHPKLAGQTAARQAAAENDHVVAIGNSSHDRRHHQFAEPERARA
jgi:hypothetical protein